MVVISSTEYSVGTRFLQRSSTDGIFQRLRIFVNAPESFYLFQLQKDSLLKLSVADLQAQV